MKDQYILLKDTHLDTKDTFLGKIRKNFENKRLEEDKYAREQAKKLLVPFYADIKKT